MRIDWKSGVVGTSLLLGIFGLWSDYPRPNTLTAQSASQAGAPYDVLIKNGHILDGAGNPWFAGDVAVRGDRIVAIGKLGDAPAQCGWRAAASSPASLSGKPTSWATTLSRIPSKYTICTPLFFI
jgi:hypothetical protein